jgi:hypothetical protein
LDGFLHRQDKNFAIADCAFRTRAAKLQEAFDGAVDKVVVHRDFQFHFAEEIGSVLVAAVRFRLAPLARKAHRVTNGETGDANPFESLLHKVKFGRLNNRDDEFHGIRLMSSPR